MSAPVSLETIDAEICTLKARLCAGDEIDKRQTRHLLIAQGCIKCLWIVSGFALALSLTWTIAFILWAWPVVMRQTMPLQ